MPDPNADPTIHRLRQQILDNDEAIVEALNTRLRLVSRLKSYKQDRGLAFVDPEREQLMIRKLTQANGGPLSRDGLREIYAVIFDLTKREVSRDSRSHEA